MQQVPPESSASQPRAATVLQLLKEVGPWFYALAIGTLYVSGFLVLNSNLAKFGVLDVEFLDARYFLAGASFILYLVCFYLFAGRAVLFTPKWLREDLERLNKDEPKPLWSFVVFAHSLITGTFFCCLSAALFTSFAIGSSETVVFYAVLAGAFLVLYTVDAMNLDIKFQRFAEAVTIVAKLVAIYAFFAHVGSGAMLDVLFSYVAIFFFINLVLDRFARYKATTDRLTFTGVYAVVFLLGTAISYGTLFYGQVTTKLGGARPQTVMLGLSEEARKALPTSFATASNQILEGKLIHQTPTYIYIATSEHTIRFRASDVVTLILTLALERNFWVEQLEHVASSSTPSNPSFKEAPADKPAGAH